MVRTPVTETWWELAQPVLGLEQGLVAPFEHTSPNPDAPERVVVLDAAGARRAMIQRASPLQPDLVGRGCVRAREIAAALSPATRAPVLLPLAEGTLEGRTWAMYPYHQPLLRGWPWERLERRRLTPALLDWLLAFAGETKHEPDAAELEAGFLAPLRALADSRQASPAPAVAARRALDALERGAWRPIHVAMHGDLWLGNLLRPSAAGRRFVIIDWPGARLRGHAIYDLLRLARSLELPRRELERQLRMHTNVLGCEPEAAQYHLTGALARLYGSLEHFSVDRFSRLAERCLQALGVCP